MEIPFSLTENGYENTPFVRKSGGFLPVKTGKSTSKIALRQRRSVFLKSNSENFPFRRTEWRLFVCKKGDFAASLDERRNIPGISKAYIAGQITKKSGQNTGNCGNFLFFPFQKRFSSNATRDFGVFNAKMAIFGVKARGFPQRQRGFAVHNSQNGCNGVKIVEERAKAGVFQRRKFCLR